MSTNATFSNDLRDEADQRPMIWMAGLVEAAASLLALFSMGALLINKAEVTVAFLGTTPTVTSENVSTYQHWLTTLAGAVVVSFGAALWRTGSAGRSLYWHGLVLLAGVLSAVAFHVALESGAPDLEPVRDRSGPVCHSGGDSEECVGG